MTRSKAESTSLKTSAVSGFFNGMKGATSQVVNTFKSYSEMEIFGKECSYSYGIFIKAINNPLIARVLASGIPLCSIFTLISKLLSDICRVLDTIFETIRTGEFAIGNIQLLLVDVTEYLRQITGTLFGLFVAWYSPKQAVQSFLCNAVDASINFLNKKETAQLYSMVDLLHKFFINHNIDYRICCGTALGAKREGGIIRNDDDIDLMLHPDSVATFKTLVDNGTFTRETRISIENQPWTGGWQSFCEDSPKGAPASPLAKIGKPFVDIFPGAWRKKENKNVISYSEDRMYKMFRSEYFTEEEWNEPKVLYAFGPTKLYGTKAIEAYLIRAYGPLALRYTAIMHTHEVYAQVYASPLRTFSILSQHSLPCYMRHEQKMPVEFDQDIFDANVNRSNM